MPILIDKAESYAFLAKLKDISTIFRVHTAKSLIHAIPPTKQSAGRKSAQSREQ